MIVKGAGKLPVGVKDFVSILRTTGFQASQVGKAVEIVKRMEKDKATVFLSFTSNMVSSGLREWIAIACRERKVGAIVTGAGAIEEDVIKARFPFVLHEGQPDAFLAKKGLNRIGNVLASNEGYAYGEAFFGKLFADLYKKKPNWTAEEIAREAGLRIKDEGSFLYWAARNGIPVYCPAPTDGALGMYAATFRQDHKDFSIDVIADFRSILTLALSSKKTGGILLGGGFAKHHVIFANLMGHGLDYAVYVGTGHDWTGSLSGATPSEALSWRKLASLENAVDVKCDATIAFPLIASAAWG